MVFEHDRAPSIAPLFYKMKQFQERSIVYDEVTHTNCFFPLAYSSNSRGTERWYGFIDWNWGSRYKVVRRYSACTSSTANSTGYLGENVYSSKRYYREILTSPGAQLQKALSEALQAPKSDLFPLRSGSSRIVVCLHGRPFYRAGHPF